MCFGAIASIAGGLLGSKGASDAAAAQQAAAAQDLAFQKETRDLIFDRLDPFYQPGVTAQNALAYELGLGSLPMIGATTPTVETIAATPGRIARAPGQTGNNAAFGGITNTRRVGATPESYRVGDKTFATMDEAKAYAEANKTGGTAYQGFKATPGYQFQFDQGTAALNALAGARGGLVSGRTMQDLTTFGQGIANQEYNNYLNRLSGMAQGGQAAAGAQANAATNAASGVSNALSGIGNAASAGAIGQANAWTGAINNGLSLWQYQKGVGGGGGGLFGGNSWGK